MIIVDWREGAEAKTVADFTAYKEAHENTKIVGKAISNFITANKIPAETVTCIGHSLGYGYLSHETYFLLILDYFDRFLRRSCLWFCRKVYPWIWKNKWQELAY